MRRFTRTAVLVLFFLSGVAGLIYEVCWARWLGLVMGNTAHAQAIVIGVFMGGLAMGSAWFGQVADRAPDPLRIYAWIEVAIGVYGLLFPLLVEAFTDLYVRVAGMSALKELQLAWLRFGLNGALLLVPTVLMGGTLPVLSRFLAFEPGRARRDVAALYCMNSLGAVVGCLVTGFALIYLVGMRHTNHLAAAINLGVGAAAWFLRTGPRRQGEEIPPAPVPSVSPSLTVGQYRVVLIALSVSGFATMVYEVCFVRMIAIGFGSSVYSFTVMLAAFITGITVGSAVISRLRLKRAFLGFGLVQWGIAAAFLLHLSAYERYPYLAMQVRTMFEPTPGGFYGSEAAKFFVVVLTLGLPTLGIGMIFPLATHLGVTETRSLGRRVGGAYGWNTLGNLLGAIGGGVLLLPWLGLERTFAVALGLNFIAGGIVLAWAAEWTAGRRAGAIALAGVAFLLALGTQGGWTVPINQSAETGRVMDPRAVPTTFQEYQSQFVIPHPVFLGEDANATVLVYDLPDDRFLAVNGKGDASRKRDLETQLLLAHLPLLFHPQPEQVLVVGLGSGITAGAALQHPIRGLDLVEISPAVVEGARAFDMDNNRALDDPRLSVHLEDACAYLKTTSKRYDVIVSEPSNPWVAGVANLFSVEYFRDCLDHLNEEGVISVWIHEYEMDDETLMLAVRTMLTVFPSVTLWTLPSFDVLLVGSREPPPQDWTRMEARLRLPAVADSLARVQVFDLATLLAHQYFDDASLRRLVGTGPIHSQFRPRLDYLAPMALFRGKDSYFFARHYERLYAPTNLPPLLAKFAEYRPLTGADYARIVDQFSVSYVADNVVRMLFVRKRDAAGVEGEGGSGNGR